MSCVCQSRKGLGVCYMLKYDRVSGVKLRSSPFFVMCLLMVCLKFVTFWWRCLPHKRWLWFYPCAQVTLCIKLGWAYCSCFTWGIWDRGAKGKGGKLWGMHMHISNSCQDLEKLCILHVLSQYTLFVSKDSFFLFLHFVMIRKLSFISPGIL